MTQAQRELRAMHDLLLEGFKANGIEHSAETCGFCSSQVDQEGRVADPKTYTEDELKTAIQKAVDAAVVKAVGEKDSEIANLRAAAEEGETAAKVAEATKPLQARVSELEDQLATKTVEADAQKQRADDLEQAEKDRLAEEERLGEIAAAKEARVAQVREAVQLDSVDKLIDEYGDKWAAMSEADFEVALGSLKAAASAAPAKARERRLPTGKSALTASEEDDGEGGGHRTRRVNGRTAPTGKTSLLRDFYDHVNS